MGEVYKARDTRLDRTVAIKVLSAHLADRADLRERFDREARTIAGLNHPHICTLFDIGHQDGIDYLVMEYLEGETLADRLKKGPLPMEQVLQYAIEISDALDKAHRNGITHRDLKPRQHHAHEIGHEVAGLRPGQIAAGRQTRYSILGACDDTRRRDRGGNDSGDAAIHGARASGGQAGRRPHGHLRFRRGGLRNGHRQESL